MFTLIEQARKITEYVDASLGAAIVRHEGTAIVIRVPSTLARATAFYLNDSGWDCEVRKGLNSESQFTYIRVFLNKE